jgi:hypothetical protein
LVLLQEKKGKKTFQDPQNLILTKEVIAFLLDREDNTLPDKVKSDILLKESHP